jgi:hypothetical protein
LLHAAQPHLRRHHDNDIEFLIDLLKAASTSVGAVQTRDLTIVEATLHVPASILEYYKTPCRQWRVATSFLFGEFAFIDRYYIGIGIDIAVIPIRQTR